MHMNQSGKLLLFIFLFSTSYISLAHKPKKHPFDFRAEIGVNHSFFQAHYPYQEPIFCQNIFPIFKQENQVFIMESLCFQYLESGIIHLNHLR